jgi:predicted aconitase
MQLGAALATSGTVAMYHIPGITPETPTLEAAFQDRKPREIIRVTREEIRKTLNQLNTAKSPFVDFVFLGCPQYTVDQVRRVAALLEGRKVHENTTLWIGTNRMAYAMAERAGYHEIIRNAGGVLVCDTCPMLSFLRLDALAKRGVSGPAFRTMLTDSPKQAKYAHNPMGCDIIVDRVDRCLDAAVRGQWEG